MRGKAFPAEMIYDLQRKWSRCSKGALAERRFDQPREYRKAALQNLIPVENGEIEIPSKRNCGLSLVTEELMSSLTRQKLEIFILTADQSVF